MALFENFPYTNLQQLNLNWIIKKLKELENTSVLSVNGMTGNVILYTDRSVQLPALLGDDLHNWAFWRPMNGTASGIQFTETGVEWVNGQNRIKLLTADDIPSSSGVVAVNGQTGVVILLGSDLVVSDTDNRTVAQAIDSIMTSEETIAGEIADINDDLTQVQTDITTINSSLSTINTDITDLDRRTDANTNSIGVQSSQISGLTANVNDLQDDTGDLNQAVTGLTASIANINNSITNLTQSILALQQELNAKKLKRVLAQHSNIVIPSSGYYLIDNFTSLNVDPDEYECISIVMRGWSGNMTPITLAMGSNGTDMYIVSEAQTITSIQIEYVFAPSSLRA